MTIPTGKIDQTVIIVVAACIVLAFGVGGLARAASPLALGEGTLALLGVAGLGVAILAMMALLIYRRRRSPNGTSADPVASTVVATLVILAMVVLFDLPHLRGAGESTPGTPPPERTFGPSADRPGQDPPMASLGGRVRADPQERPEAEPAVAVPPKQQTPSTGRGGMEIDVLQIGMILLAFLVIAIVLIEAIRRALTLRRTPLRTLDLVPSPSPVPEELEAAMQKSVADLAEEGRDPGNQITTAYFRLLEVLELAGFPRKPQEAPHEHLHRALVRLGVSPAPMQRLTELYVFAEFGRGEVGTTHRRAASEALEVSLEAMRRRYPTLGSPVGAQLEEARAQ